MKPEILVHACCAPDALYVFKLLREDHEVTGYFYNPNIHPKEEYEMRLAETHKVSDSLNMTLIEGEYDPESWFEVTKKFITEPEKGRRCDICYALRLKNTAALAAEKNIGLFTTVMSLSPWKKVEVMNRTGRMWAARYGISFLEANFKKKDGFRKSVRMSGDFGLYRQNYCGCEYSRR